MIHHVHQLDGCAPTPLGHYLKALGILRLVAEQTDSEARGWWDGDRFRLGSRLVSAELREFFLQKYSPTPMLAPWNGASGFFKTWDKKRKALRNSKNHEALDKIRRSKEPRWSAFRNAWTQATNLLNRVTKLQDVSELTDKERGNLLIIPSETGSLLFVADKDQDKIRIQTEMQHALNKLLFYRSAIIDVGENEPAYPSIWGSGGNDGAFDFTARYMENLMFVLDPGNVQSDDLLRSALSGSHVTGLLKGTDGKVGQFIPGGAGGANSVNGTGTQQDTLLNPWDFVLLLEGAVCFTSHVSRQSGSNFSRFASPFTVSACGAAYPSASADDEGARGEQWMPLWSQPSTYRELRQLLAEGRAQIGAKVVREPLDLARAVKRLGVARGIRSFQRYGYIERNGQSNLAVPLGRFDVANRASEHLICIDDLDSWLRRLRREARDKNAPARLRQVEKRLVDALFTVTAEHSQSPDRWQGVLSQLTEAEAIMRQGTGYEAQPIPPLRPEWVVASNDGTPEFRLALAFALQEGGCGKSGISVDPIRRHWLPLDQDKPWRFATGGSGLDMQPDVVMHGRCGLDDAIALVQRRLVEASQQEGRHLPLNATMPPFASIADLTALLTGHVDLDRTLALARSLMALNRKAWRTWAQKHIMERPHGSDWPDDVWLAIRLCTLPWPIRTRSGFDLDIGADPALIRRLDAGDAAKAFVIASRRLRTAGVHCTIRSGAAPPDTARLWAAALAFPITKTTARSFLYHLDPSKE